MDVQEIITQYQQFINMAKCKKCGANVGCGCNLTNGLCAYCVAQTNTTP